MKLICWHVVETSLWWSKVLTHIADKKTWWLLFRNLLLLIRIFTNSEKKVRLTLTTFVAKLKSMRIWLVKTLKSGLVSLQTLAENGNRVNSLIEIAVWNRTFAQVHFVNRFCFVNPGMLRGSGVLFILNKLDLD